MSDQFPSPAPVPRRPEPEERAAARLVRRVRLLWSSLRQPKPSDEFDERGGARQPDTDRRAVMLTGLSAVGAALLALGALYGWQTWSQRSSTPIDDLLPVLAAGQTELVDESIGHGPRLEESAVTSAVASPSEVAGAAVAATAEPTVAAALIVHVSGAVAQPGIVELAPGSRVYEAVEEAGGSLPTADLERVNLAAPLGDGERIHVPMIGEDELPVVVHPEPAPAMQAATSDSDAPVISVLVDINAASELELQELPGVGPSTAEAIVRTRNDRGPFLQVEELREVPGIGETKLATLLPYVVVVVP